MVDTVRQLKIFIASPCDCEFERETVRRLCNEDPTIKIICRANQISLDVLGWEELFPDLGRSQSIINAAVEKYKPEWFVFIFWHRFGSNAGLGMTGTEEEWNLARQMNEMGFGHPKVSIYFNNESAPAYVIDGYQLEALKKFQERIFSEHQALACLFKGTRDFEDKFRGHLTEFLLSLDGGHPTITTAQLRQELLSASDTLLHYQRTIIGEQQIERHEFKELLHCIEEAEHSTTILLGSPGSGKSSLLSTLVHNLKENGIALLAIKADTLNSDINTSKDLQKALNLSEPYPVCWTHKSEIKYSCGGRYKWQRQENGITKNLKMA